ncbi:MAG TPA: quinone-dependent dihydroorotate dehydrogenase [Candidatus Magasanikbacteria bacterium]|nr:quinone-dependent dihydroorotate dehydrogenase [Candidatus Magasanikbacteria bacterium]
MHVIIGLFYRHILKKVFFLFDPETVHDRMIRFGVFLGSHPSARRLVRRCLLYQHPMLEQTISNIHFKNPIGLAAGFDKNAELTGILPSLGFGFAEVGSITGEPCVGNLKPRLWRLKKDRAILVHYGLKNDGAVAIADRLREKKFSIPLGISVAKTNCEKTVETQAGIDDYTKAYRLFVNIGAYTTVNISCPNAFGGQPFTDPQKLDALLDSLDAVPSQKPVFLKLSPDLSSAEIDAILRVCHSHRVLGFICTNLTKKRLPKHKADPYLPLVGGMSGKVVEQSSDNLLKTLYQKTKGQYILIGCGGVFTAEDAYKKIRLGASLVQMVTGMIFQGPQVIGEINRGLVRCMKRDGFSSLADAVGVDSV